jgi:hypothetical protein
MEKEQMNDNEESSQSAGGATSSPRGRQYRPRTHGRWGGLAILAAAAAIELAACSGGSNSPQVATLGNSSVKNGGSTSTSSGNSSVNNGGSTPTSSAKSSGSDASGTTLPKGNATVLLDGWATCMRGHGDPNQADPTIDANKVIHITWNPAIPGGYDGTNQGGQGNLGPGQYCREYLTEAQTALQGGQPSESASQAQLVQFADCMRANGIPDFPDPTNGNLSFNRGAGGDLNPNNPSFQKASKLCAQKTGVHVPGAGGGPPPGSIEINGAAPPGSAGSGANG